MSIWSRIEKALVMRDAVAQLVDGLELQVELRPVGSGRPCGVQIRYPKVALAASVCHVGPEAEHDPAIT